MGISDQLLSTFVSYGLPVLFGVILLAAAGLPLPATLLLIATGALADDGQFSYPLAVGVGITAAVLGDNLGYGASRWGGRKFATRLQSWAGGEERLEQAKHTTQRWGGAGIFLSRWLLTPVGPAINITSGLTNYPWRKFVVFDLVGEAAWVVLYTAIGRIFSDRVQAISSLAGNLTWVVCGVALVGFLIWRLVRGQHAEPQTSASAL